MRHGFRDEVVAAGYVHDAMEDAGITYEELERALGREVADLVRHVSEEDKDLPWEERKSLYLEHFKVKPWEAQAISLADKIDNFESIITCTRFYGNPWSMFKRGREAQLRRFDDILEVARTLAPHPLIQEYERALQAVRDLEVRGQATKSPNSPSK